MPVVPSPEAPSVSPTGAPLSPFQTAAGATPDAFGAGIGQAVQGLGHQVDRSGDMLARHAIEMQNMANEELVNNSVTDAVIAEGKVTNKLNAMEGMERSNYYASGQYTRDLAEARKSIREGLPNPYAKRLFDQSTMRQYGYAEVNGARSAATAFRTASSAAAKARKEVAGDAAAHKLDDEQFEDSLKDVENIIKMDPDYQGKGEDVIRNEVNKEIANRWAKRIEVISYNSPERALVKLREKADVIDPNVSVRLADQVMSRLMTSRATKISTSVVDQAEVTPFHGLIGRAEGTDAGRGYDETLSYGKFTGGPLNLQGKTVAEVLDIQKSMLKHPDNTYNSSAAGRFQVVSTTLQGLVDDGTVGLTDKYDKDTQNKIATELATRRGPNPTELRKEWEGLKNVSDEEIVSAWNASFGKNKTPPIGEGPGQRQQMATRAKAMAAAQADALGLPEDKKQQMIDLTEKAVDQRHARQMADYRDAVLGDKLTVMDALIDLENPPKSEQELRDRLGAEGQKAFDRLPASLRGTINTQLQRNALNVPMTPERQELFEKLMGRSYDPDQKRAFLDEGPEAILAADLPWSPKKTLLGRVQALKNAMNAPTPVDAAFRQLQNENMFEGTQIKVKGPLQDHFRGALATALEAEKLASAGAPTPQRIREIGAAVKQQVIVPSAWWGTKKDVTTPVEVQGRKALDASVPAEAGQRLVSEITKRYPGIKLQPGQLYDVYQKNKSRLQGTPTTPAAAEPPRADEASLTDGP